MSSNTVFTPFDNFQRITMMSGILGKITRSIEKITQGMDTLEKRVKELEHAQRGGQGGGAGFRMKKSMSRKRNPKKKSRTAKRGKKEKKEQ